MSAAVVALALFSFVCPKAKKAPERVPLAWIVVQAGRPAARPAEPDHLILDSLNSTCLRATGSYLVLVIFSVIVREFFLVT